MVSVPDLTFGVELELILGFDADVLQQQLNKTNPSKTIVRHPGNVVRANTRGTMYYEQLYRSWALSRTADEMVSHETALIDRSDMISVKDYTTYSDEPLQIARDLLINSEAFSDAKLHTSTAHKQHDFSAWTVVHDASINALDRTALAERLGLCEQRCQNWDSYGIELVSPVYSRTHQLFDHVQQAMCTLQHGTSHNVIVNAQTGFHVHVGLPDGSRFPIEVLQHLAYITIVFEHVLDEMMELSRRSTEGNAELYSNRESFFAVDYSEDSYNKGIKQAVYMPLKDIKKRVFDSVHSSPDPHRALVTLMGSSKQHLINWTYTARSPGQGPATIEFRQHAGTLDAHEVVMWTRFCISLVNLAYALTQHATLFTVDDWDEYNFDIENLWTGMRLQEDVRAYYAAKVNEYRSRWPEWRRAPLWEAPIEDPAEPRVEEAVKEDTQHRVADDGYHSGSSCSA